MKLTPKTIAVLKNFHNINAAICFQPGDVIKTISISKTILATAKVDVTFARKFCIYDLSRFLHTVGLFKEPELTVNESTVDIGDTTSSVSYRCAGEKGLVLPDKPITLPDEVPYNFNLTNANMHQIFKATSILGLTDVAVIGDGHTLVVKGLDPDGKSPDTYTLTLGTTDKTYKAIFKIDNLNKLVPGDYQVKIDKVPDDLGQMVNVSHFKNLSEDMDYWVVCSSESKL